MSSFLESITSTHGPISKLNLFSKAQFYDVIVTMVACVQRVNGRLAMWGFATGVAAELSSHESIVEQLGVNPVGIVFFALLIAVGSVMPKFAAGVPIGKKSAHTTFRTLTSSSSHTSFCSQEHPCTLSLGISVQQHLLCQ